MRKLLGLVVLLMPILAVAQQSRIDGTWKIDLNKGKMDSTPRIFELKGGTFSCMTCDPKVTIPADGQDHKITGSPYFDSESATVVNPDTVELVGKKDGKIAFREKLMASSDGKTMTENYEGHPVASSEPVTATGMYSRVGEPRREPRQYPAHGSSIGGSQLRQTH